MLTSQKGTYILIMKAEKSLSIVIRKLGVLNVQPGYCAYVGSAFGSSGLKARLGHHMKTATRPHWHIDFLRKEVDLIKNYFIDSEERLESSWAKRLEVMPKASIPLIGFGASDCDANSHLFYFKDEPDLSDLEVRLCGSDLNSLPFSGGGLGWGEMCKVYPGCLIFHPHPDLPP